MSRAAKVPSWAQRGTLLALLVLTGCAQRGAVLDLHARGAAELEAGRATAASALLEQALDLVAPERRSDHLDLLHDRALAALRADELATAESVARELVAADDRARVADGWLVIGAVRARRADRARAQAEGPEAEPFAFDAAIALANEAQAAFASAVLVRGGWSAAARNVERMAARSERWTRERDAAEPAASVVAADGTPNVQLVPTDDGSGTAPATGEDAATDTARAPLGALGDDELAQLLEALVRAEQDKLDARAQRRRSTGTDVEKDW
ncbi:hypothetical protein Pla163_21810 [Planctomycetes bacterium Pla163]|uniref:Tetratricopeptide repeat protein n=1 Tax=Rohdeia mirabilis TaxID=2528008 RepID=A0A518D0P4_9BACT|nr:hypothetical protein Pla163_21810 [Planctomycetes bacterium Pla163]